MLTCGTADAKGCGRESPAGFPHPAELPFRWTTTEDPRLPWIEYDRKSGKTLDRLIQPDGLLELLAPRPRLFLECEMGKRSIVRNEHKGGASIAKAERYADPKSGETFYAQQFPDRAPPELLFLVTSEARRDSANAALATWRKERHRLSARAVVVPEIARELCDVLRGLPPASPSRRLPPSVTTSEARELKGFFNEVISTTKAACAAARANRAPLPEYPPGSERVGKLVGRFIEELDGSSARGAGR